MKPEYILKLATTQPVNQQKPDKQQEPAQKRYVNPLAILKANQMGLSQEEIQNGSMLDNLAKITNNIKSGKIKTAGVSSNVFSPLGLTSQIAFLHSQPTISDTASKISKILSSPWMTRQGYKGSWDAVAFANAMTDPNAMKGKGEKIFSIAKDKDIASKPSPGRYGNSNV